MEKGGEKGSAEDYTVLLWLLHTLPPPPTASYFLKMRRARGRYLR
jgi:hypothetical protein